MVEGDGWTRTLALSWKIYKYELEAGGRIQYHYMQPSTTECRIVHYLIPNIPIEL